MDNGTDDPLREILELIRSYIRRGSLNKLDVDPNTGEVKDSKNGEGIVPDELFSILEQMLGGDNKLPPEIVEMFRNVEKQMRDKEASLTPEQRQQLQDFYDKLKKVKTHRDLKKAEAEKNQLDMPVQDAFEAQLRIRQGLASRILEAWKQQNQQEEEGEGEDDGEGDESEPYPDESDLRDDSDGDSNGESDDSDGDADGDGQSEPYSDDSTTPEDYQKGLQQWLEKLEEETRQQEQEAAEQQEAQAEQAAQEGEEGEEGQDGNDGKEKQPGLFGGQNDDPAIELSNDEVDPRHARTIMQAFAKILSRGKNEPTVLPRWNTRKFVKRQITGRPLRPAKLPTLEHKTIVFIIDNSGSMSDLEHAARAFAAAVRKASGPRGPDVVVATSFNGQYVIDSTNPPPQKECWFLNGEYKGHLPLPPSGAYDRKYQGPCWEWFIRKELPRFCSPVHLVGIYGDNNGGHVWCYISNMLKQVSCLWFNPSNQQGHAGKGDVIAEKRPYIADRSNLVSTAGHAAGDPNYEVFRGLSFLNVTSGDDIVDTLKRYIGN